MSHASPWAEPGARRAAGAARAGLSRRGRLLVVAGEAVIAAIVGGIVVGGALGWTIAVAAAAVAALGAVLLRGRWPIRERVSRGTAGELVAGLRAQPVVSRSSGEVGVVGDAQGFAAGLELEVGHGALLDLAALCQAVAADPSRPAAVQVRLTSYAPPAPGSGVFRRAPGTSIAAHHRLQVVLRFEPVWASDVVARHGGGAQGSRAALVAALDRLSAWLRRSGIANRALDARALNALLAEETAPELRGRVFSADLGGQPDLDRLMQLLHSAGAERSILSVCADLASSEQWQTCAALLVGGRDPQQTDAAGAAVLSDPSVVGVAPPSAIATVLPLGGGPADLAAVLTLARQ